MKIISLIMLGFIFSLGFSNSAYSQITENNLNSLNRILKTSLFESSIAIVNDSVFRQDNNKNTFEFKASDVIKVTYKFDGFHNAFIWVEEDKSVRANIKGDILQSSYNVFSFKSDDNCSEAIKLMKKIFLK